MILYWTMFLLPVMASLSPYRLDRLSRAVMMVLLGVVLTAVIGLRDHVGHDWNNYMNMFERADASDFFYVVTSVEPGYAFLNWASSRLGTGIYGVNAVCAAILVFGQRPQEFDIMRAREVKSLNEKEADVEALGRLVQLESRIVSSVALEIEFEVVVEFIGTRQP